MNKRAIILVLFCCLFLSCTKNHLPNENALVQQKACIESLDLGDYQRALTHCELCLEYDAQMAECLNGIGLIALANKDQEKAKTFFSRALRQNNDYSEARNNLGVTYFTDGNFSMALRYFDKALEINPSNIDARYNKALSHFRVASKLIARKKTAASLTELALAKEHLAKVLALEPNYYDAYRDLGLIELNFFDLVEFSHEQQSHLKSAEEAFTNCVQANNDFDGCFEGLGQVYFEQGQYDKAFANYFICLSRSNKNSACRTGIVSAFEKSAHAEGGYKKFSEKVGSEPKDAVAHEAFCAALFERGLDREAVSACEKAIAIDHKICNAHFHLADYFTSVLDSDRALNHCQSYLRCEPERNSKNALKCTEILSALRQP